MHLDIKPANILLQENGEPLLIDFGAAQRFESANRPGQMQTVTHGFAPPEQYDRNKKMGPWSDIYAVAATIYNCITGLAPTKSTLHDQPTVLDPDQYGERYGRQLILAINRALSYDARSRYESIDEFAYHLLESSPWRTLSEYEQVVMNYDRNKTATYESQKELNTALALT